MQPNITITYQPVTRFEVGDPAATNYLEKEGFVVFASALTENQADHAKFQLEKPEHLVSPLLHCVVLQVV